MSPLFIKIDVMFYILILREKMMLFPTLLVMMLINGDIYVIVKDLDYSYVVVECQKFFFYDILRSYGLINGDIYVIVKDLDYSCGSGNVECHFFFFFF